MTTMDVQMKQAQRATRGRAPGHATHGSEGVAASSSIGGPALEAAAQRANAGPHGASLFAMREVVAQRECADCEHVRRAMGGAAPAQRAAKDTGGLPDGLRAGLENLSGRDLSGVSVHYDSPRPAQLNAHAYAQGSTIHVAPGQEQHLPHEGWHAVQQMQNRIRPTTDLGGTPVNDSAQLEREADVMGARAPSAGGGAAQLGRAATAPVRGGGGDARGVVQGAWEYRADEDRWENFQRVEGKLWEWRLRNGGDEYRFFDMRNDEPPSAWAPADVFVQDGNPPPMGAAFAEQRRRAGAETGVSMEQGSHRKYAFVPGGGEHEPLPVRQVRAQLQAGLAKIREQVNADKTRLDELIREEFDGIEALAARVSMAPADHAGLLLELFTGADVEKILKAGTLNAEQDEELKAGLRYKRVYEHEQNLLTVNRRSTGEYLALIQGLKPAEDDGEDQKGEEKEEERPRLTRDAEQTDAGTVERISLTVGEQTYLIGTFYFGDARFELAGQQPDGALNETYQHRETRHEYVRDRNERFVPRYVRRAIRYEDVLRLDKGERMETKMKYDDPATGKEATDYGDPDLRDRELTHEQKVMGQIRGYSRFLSATTSGRLATSTSRGTYESPFGGVAVDLAHVPRDSVTDAHTEEALDDIFSVDDLGMLEFIPKHLSGETSEAKAARDAYRAREVVMDPPPQEAVLADSQMGGPGIIVIGLTNKATEAQVRAAVPGDVRGNITYMEVNTRYQRTVDDGTVDGKKGRSAFIFFTPGTEIDAAMEALRLGAPGINAGAYVTRAPAGYQPAH